MKEDLKAFVSWCIENGLSLNVDKCCYSIFSKHNVSDSKIEFVIDNLCLPKKDTVRDLGVLFDSKLDFKEHIDYTTTKAFRKLYFVLRQSRVFKNVATVIYLYKSLVVPTLMCASSVWRPFFNVDLL